jgi:hypothetical protein
MIKMLCPICKMLIEVTEEFYEKRDKICCMSCNKAFSLIESKKQRAFERGFNEITEDEKREVERMLSESFTKDDSE